MKKNVLIVLFLAFGVIVFYGVRYVKTPIRTERAYLIDYGESIRAEAVIIRNETVNIADKNGTLYTYASDGDRVGKNDKIASVYKEGVDEDILKELNNTDKKIQSVKANSLKNMQNSDMSDESMIMACVDEISEAVYNGNISEIYAIKAQIKSIRGREVDGESDDLATLEDKRVSLESRVENLKNDVYSKSAGIFVSGIDGMESLLTPESMENMTVSDFNALPRDIGEKSSSYVSAGDGICKVADNNCWYIALKTEADRASEINIGDKVSVRFDYAPGVEIDAQIHAVSEEENGEVLLFIKCEKYADGIFSIRYSDVEVIFRRYKGYPVPVYAIRVQDNQTGVMVMENFREKFKPCKIIYTDDEFVIIQSEDDSQNKINENDVIIIGEK